MSLKLITPDGREYTAATEVEARQLIGTRGYKRVSEKAADSKKETK